MKYRKKPVVIEARQFTEDDGMDIYQWIESETLGSFEPLDCIEGRVLWPASGVTIDPRDGRMVIATLEGGHWVNLGDWIIRGVHGEFYPCKPDIFEATYDPAPAEDEEDDEDDETDDLDDFLKEMGDSILSTEDNVVEFPSKSPEEKYECVVYDYPPSQRDPDTEEYFYEIPWKDPRLVHVTSLSSISVLSFEVCLGEETDDLAVFRRVSSGIVYDAMEWNVVGSTTDKDGVSWHILEKLDG